MKLDDVSSLGQLEKLLKDTKDDKIGYLAAVKVKNTGGRDFCLKGSDNTKINAKMHELVTKFQELADKAKGSNDPNELRAIRLIQSELIELDLAGDKEVENQSLPVRIATAFVRALSPSGGMSLKRLGSYDAEKLSAEDLEIAEARNRFLIDNYPGEEKGKILNDVKGEVRQLLYMSKENPSLASLIINDILREVNVDDRDLKESLIFIKNRAIANDKGLQEELLHPPISKEAKNAVDKFLKNINEEMAFVELSDGIKNHGNEKAILQYLAKKNPVAALAYLNDIFTGIKDRIHESVREEIYHFHPELKDMLPMNKDELFFERGMPQTGVDEPELISEKDSKYNSFTYVVDSSNNERLKIKYKSGDTTMGELLDEVAAQTKMKREDFIIRLGVYNIGSEEVPLTIKIKEMKPDAITNMVLVHKKRT